MTLMAAPVPTQRPSRYRVEVLTSPGPLLEAMQRTLALLRGVLTSFRYGPIRNRNRQSHVDMAARKANNLKRSPLNRFEP